MLLVRHGIAGRLGWSVCASVSEGSNIL